MAIHQFPFSRPVQPVSPLASGPRRVFVIGVYPSAVHARWIGPDGKQLIAAVAVDNEPEPFWSGTDAAERIEAINATMPAGTGTLVSAAGNGPSGQALDSHYLDPLGLDRSDCWITDLDNRWYANPAQLAALERSYTPMVAQGLLPPFHLSERPGRISVHSDRTPALDHEWSTAAPELLITLGDEPAKALGLPGPSRQRYGTLRQATCWDRTVQHLALVHPRQAARLGTHDPEWAAIHQSWMASAPHI